MANINEILARAAALRDETSLNSIDPERAGGIMYDTLIALNELWLQQGAALVISKIYASVAAMNADTSPVSDLTGKPIRPGMIVVIASSDSDNGSVYRYNGTSSPSWSLVGKIGNLEPVDSLDSDSTHLPLAAHQGKVLDGKISQLDDVVGQEQTITLTSADYAGLFWGGDQVYAATSRFNGLVLKLAAGHKYRISGTITSITQFENYPNIGDTQIIQSFSIETNVDFISPVDCYALVSVETNNGIVFKKYSAGLSNAVEEMEKVVVPLAELMGHKKQTETLTQDNFAGLFWGGVQVYAATSSYNGFVVKLVEGQKYQIDSASSALSFADYPQIGDTSFVRDLPNVFNAQAGEKYMLITVPASTQSFDIVLFPFGLAKLDGLDNDAMSGIHLVNNYDGLFWGGQVYAATSSYNGFVVYVPKGQTELYIKNIEKGYMSASCFADYPYIGLSTLVGGEVTISLGDITRITLPANTSGLYVLVTIRLETGVDISKVYYMLANEAYDAAVAGLKGKKILCLGDSITEFLDNNSFNYPAYLSQIFGATVYGCGVGGTRLSRRAPIDPTTIDGSYGALDVASMAQAIYNRDFTQQIAAAQYLKDHAGDDNTAQIAVLASIDFDSLDWIIVMAGTNDWTGDVPIGTDTDAGDFTTIKGGIRKIVSYLCAGCPNARILFMAEPVRYFQERDRAHWCDVYQNGNGNTLTDVINAIIESTKFNHVPVVNLYHDLGWNEFNFDTYFRYPGGDVDLTHPYSGFKAIAQMAGKYIKNCYY